MSMILSTAKQSIRKSKLRTFIAAASALPAMLFTLALPFSYERHVASVPTMKNWGIDNKVGNSHIHAVDAWKVEEGSRDIVVAVIDTGIDPNHPDLKANLWRDKETGIFGWDFVKNKANPIDEHGHGSHVAGIIGASLNRQAGISGVVHKVSIMPVKYYSEKSSGAENLRNSVRALNWAIDHGAHIINYSGGGPEFSMDEYVAIRRARDKGVLVVAAAGNDHSDGDQSENHYYPCAYRLDNIICVSATNIKNDLLGSSNWGKLSVDFAAPGENILSTVPGGKYSYMSGSSQATAFGTGVAVMLLSKNKSLTPARIKNILRMAVDPVPALANKVFSGGKLNAVLALSILDRQSGATVVAEQPAPKVDAPVKTPDDATRVTAGKRKQKLSNL